MSTKRDYADKSWIHDKPPTLRERQEAARAWLEAMGKWLGCRRTPSAYLIIPTFLRKGKQLESVG